MELVTHTVEWLEAFLFTGGYCVVPDKKKVLYEEITDEQLFDM